jgi:predicted nucleic acid-binding Zn ribbon protein
MSRRRDPARLSELLPHVLGAIQGTSRVSREEIGKFWNILVGSETARHSWPIRLAEGSLVVEVENSGWLYELHLRKVELLEGLMELIGAQRVQRLSLRLGERQEDVQG